MRCAAPPHVVSGALVMTIINTGDDDNHFIHSGGERALVLPTGIYPPLPWASGAERLALLEPRYCIEEDIYMS